MYDTKYLCRYHKDDIFLETDDVTNEEKDFIRHILYKEDLLSIFKIDAEQEFEIFDIILGEIYDKIKDNEFLQNCMIKVSSSLFCQNVEFGLCLLYSYDFMSLTHKCVSEYLETGNISEFNSNLLNNAINN